MDGRRSSDEASAMNTSVHGETSSARRPRWRRPLLIGGQLLLGLGLGLVVTEVVFSQRADGAFPHANFYVADPALGVRLEPGASMRFQLRQNPVTTIHVNGRGYRGGEWPAPTGDEVLVVGDSQVFGLGVEDDATFSAALARSSGRAVINAGVPTYGPQEYLAVARALIAERRPRTVVVALNFVNDPFELDRPNSGRHAVWDGWAVRSETAPAEVFEFPGRRWLFSRSHAVYAVRRWLHERGTAAAPVGAELGEPLDPGLPSEGGLADLVAASRRAHADVDTTQRTAAAELAQSQVRLDSIGQELESSRDNIDSLVEQHIIARGRPGDIVEEESSEEGRSVRLTAAMVRKIARERNKYVKAMLRDPAFDDAEFARKQIKTEEALLAERKLLRERIAAGIPEPARPPSLFHDYLAQFKALCDEHGAELVVVALPIDVQVDPREWDKYGVHDAPDMRESLILLADLVADAQDLGLRALDATAPLRTAEPGAFLDHDIHMTATGHAALAEALAATLATPLPRPLRRPTPGLPKGRSFVPTHDEWTAAGEVQVAGSGALGCKTQIQREWLRVQCQRQKPRDRFDAIELREGDEPATMIVHTADALSLVTPMKIGGPISVRFWWKTGAHDLEIRWPEDADGKPKFVGRFVAVPDAPAREDKLRPEITELCACQQQVFHDQFCVTTSDPDDDGECSPSCGELWGDPALDEACRAAHPKDCAARLACIQHDPVRAPTCPEGQVHAFTSNACRAICDDDHPCAAGECIPWYDGSVCL